MIVVHSSRNQAGCTVTFVLLRTIHCELLCYTVILVLYPLWIPLTWVVPRVFIDKQGGVDLWWLVGINIPKFKSKTVGAAKKCLNQVSISAAAIHCLSKSTPHEINRLAQTCVKCSLFNVQRLFTLKKTENWNGWDTCVGHTAYAGEDR